MGNARIEAKNPEDHFVMKTNCTANSSSFSIKTGKARLKQKACGLWMWNAHQCHMRFGNIAKIRESFLNRE